MTELPIDEILCSVKLWTVAVYDYVSCVVSRLDKQLTNISQRGRVGHSELQ